MYRIIDSILKHFFPATQETTMVVQTNLQNKSNFGGTIVFIIFCKCYRTINNYKKCNNKYIGGGNDDGQ